MSAASDDDATLPGDGVAPLDPRRHEREGWLMPGAPVGRYMVLSRLGSGGMGVVYAAYDPELDRKVALKLLRPGPSTSAGPRDEQHRMLKQEAQALAKLSHPNVIAVHDVGEHEGRVFLAMEFVAGRTLGAWLEQPHDWREILEAFLRAGEGLRAAHEQGLVHRDFKPDNVMVGDDGRVRVMDFGLARSAALLDGLEATGLVGTPAYMAPEQHAGVGVDARSDQFSFCVALWEGLYGTRPFEAETLTEILDNIYTGRTTEPRTSEHGTMPGWIRQALLRGLQADPEHRWPSMEPLLCELARQPDRRRWQLLGAGGVAIASAALVLALRPDQGGPRCEPPGPEVAGAWDAERRTAVEQALVATGVSHAAPTWARVEQALDAYGSAWTGVRHQLCEQPPQDGLTRERTVCLDRRKRALRLLVEVLAAADAAVVEEAVGSIARLPEPERCLDVAYVSADVEPPGDPAVAAEVEAQRERLARVEALLIAGKAAAARDELPPVLEAATTLGYAPLLGEARLLEARLDSAQGHGEAAVAHARDAYERLVTVGHDELAARAALTLVSELGDRSARPDEGLEWVPTARGLARRAELGTSFEADLHLRVGNVHLARGAFDDAAPELERSLTLRVEQAGPQHVSVYPPALGLGSLYAQRGDLDQAAHYTERALQVAERALGSEHPDVAAILLNLGNLYVGRGDLDRARALYERSLAITEAARGPEHPELVLGLSNLGALEQQQGQLAAAQRSFERALAVAEATSGPEHPNAALALTNLSFVLLLQGEQARAEGAARRAVEIWEVTLGPEPAHPHAAAAVNNLASALAHRKATAEALAAFGRSVALWEAALGPDSVALVDPLLGLADTRLELGLYAEALAAAERALGLQQTAPEASPETLALTKAVRARAAWGTGSARDEAVAEIRAARERLAASKDPQMATRLETLDRWLTSPP